LTDQANARKKQQPMLHPKRAANLALLGLTSSELISHLGNQIAAVAIPILVLQQTHSPLATGIASAANTLPMVFAALCYGVFAKYLSAYAISILSDVLSALSSLLLPLAFLYFAPLPTTLIFLLILLGALFDPLGAAARQSLLPSLARKAGRPLPRVNALRGGLENGADFLGPALAITLIHALGSSAAFFVNAASFAGCAVLFALSVRRRKNRRIGTDTPSFLLGLQFLLRNRTLRTLMLAGVFASFVLSAFLGLLLPVLAVQEFKKPAILAIALSAFGFSAAIGAFAFAGLRRVLSSNAIFYGGLFACGLGIALCAGSAQVLSVAAACALAGFLLGAGNPLQQTLLQEQTPPELSGQVFAALNAMQLAAGPLGLVCAGMAAQYVQVRVVILIAGLALGITAVAASVFMPLAVRAR
jgi:MFS family permease